MDWEQWKLWYNKIIADFQYNPQLDLESAIKLNKLLEKKSNLATTIDLEELIRENIIFIYGCGPSLVNHLEFLKSSLFRITLLSE